MYIGDVHQFIGHCHIPLEPWISPPVSLLQEGVDRYSRLEHFLLQNKHHNIHKYKILFKCCHILKKKICVVTGRNGKPFLLN